MSASPLELAINSGLSKDTLAAIEIISGAIALGQTQDVNRVIRLIKVPDAIKDALLRHVAIVDNARKQYDSARKVRRKNANRRANVAR